MPRARYRYHRRASKPYVSPLHKKPGAVLPIPGCKCDECENLRIDKHGEMVGNLLGMEPEQAPEMPTDDLVLEDEPCES